MTSLSYYDYTLEDTIARASFRDDYLLVCLSILFDALFVSVPEVDDAANLDDTHRDIVAD